MRTPFNFVRSSSETFASKSDTRPGQAVTIGQFLDRINRGLPLPRGMVRPVYYDSAADVQHMRRDVTFARDFDIAQASQVLSENSRQLSEQVSADLASVVSDRVKRSVTAERMQEPNTSE